MPLYAKIDRATLTVLEHKIYDNPQLSDNPDKPKWVLVVDPPQPAFNPSTQKLLRVENVSLTNVQVTFTVVALTAEEKRDRIDPITDLANALIAKGVITKVDLNSRLGRS